MADERPSAGARASLAFAVAGRDAADYARGLVADVDKDHSPGERIRQARQLRIITLLVLDRAVLVEALTGTSWDAISDALMIPKDEVIRRYAPTVQRWRDDLDSGRVDATIFGDFTTGLLDDPDPEGTARTVDAWVARHAEPWDVEPDGAGPVTRALHP